MVTDAAKKSRRSDSLYYDHVTRRELCDMVAHLESCVEEADIEIARLKDDLGKCHKEVEVGQG